MRSDPYLVELAPERLLAVLNGVLDGVVVTDLQGNVLYLNSAARSLYGFERLASHKGRGHNLPRYAKDTFDITDEAGRPVPDEEQPFLRALKGEPYQNATLYVRHKERREVKVLAFSGALIDGDVPLNVLTIRDLTEQHKADQRYRISFETNPAPTLIVTLDDTVLIDANEGLCEMTGLPKDETLGRSLTHVGLLPEKEDLQRVIDGLKEGRGIENVQTTIDAPSRGRRTVVVSARPIEIEGRACGIFTFLDITDLRASEALVERRTRELREANDELEAFNYSVSHDLRGPLRGIDGFSQVLLEEHGEVLDEDGRRMLHRVRSAARKMGDLIDALLRLSKFSRLELQYQQVDLSGVAEHIASRLQSKEPERQVEVVIAPGVIVSGDPQLLRSALDNLFENAWNYTRDQAGARIEFGVLEGAEEGRRTVLFVRDNGVGFDMRYADKLFTPFWRLHREDQFAGLGIGLSIVHRIVHRHGGRIWAKSTPGEGTTLFFTLSPE